MFSKALFKQSCKANGIMWAIITFAVCFMLACVMMISGSGNIGNIRNGITNTIVESAMDAQVKSRAVNYYSITNQGFEKFDEAFISKFTEKHSELVSSGIDAETAKTSAQAYAMQAGITAVNEYINAVASTKKIQAGSVEMQELQGLMFCAFNLDLNSDGVEDFKEFYDTYGTEISPYTTTLPTISSENRASERYEYARKYSSVFLAGNMISDANIEKVCNELEKYSIDKEAYAKLTYDIIVNNETKQASRYTGETGFNYIKNMAIDSIVTFKSQLDYELSQLNTADPNYLTKAQEIQTKLISSTGKSFLSSLPAEVSESLEELGSMDLFGMIIGSIFFKMAGLLLPIIYIIMVSNNLIAGQVDRGSMAYILSTSTKRKQVVFTQAVFLVLSLFAMFSLSTITSCICLSLLNNSAITITYGDLVLFNLGAFITLFAMSGISFLASCWFNRSKYSMSLGGGLNMFFLVATMLGLFGSNVLPKVVRLKALNFFNYCSIISLFDEQAIINGSTAFIWKFAILIAIGLVCYIIGGIKFKKKDLPLWYKNGNYFPIFLFAYCFNFRIKHLFENLFAF